MPGSSVCLEVLITLPTEMVHMHKEQVPKITSQRQSLGIVESIKIMDTRMREVFEIFTAWIMWSSL